MAVLDTLRAAVRDRALSRVRAAQSEPAGDLARLAAALGHDFTDPGLLEEAVTHPSLAAPGGRRAKVRHYDRLEFLGDRVLGLLVADLLHRRYPQAEAGELARRFNALVRQESLAMVAEGIALGNYLRLSRSEQDTGGRAKPAILADVCEAVIAALYLDGGLKAASAFVDARFGPLVEAIASPAKDAKTALQEWAAARDLPPPVYRVQTQEGPPHAPMFTVTVEIKGFPSLSGRGKTKRVAEQGAARALLKALPKDAL